MNWKTKNDRDKLPKGRCKKKAPRKTIRHGWAVQWYGHDYVCLRDIRSTRTEAIELACDDANEYWQKLKRQGCRCVKVTAVLGWQP